MLLHFSCCGMLRTQNISKLHVMATQLTLQVSPQTLLPELASQESSGSSSCPAVAAWSGLLDPAFQGGFEGCVGLLATLIRLTPLFRAPQQNTAGSKVEHSLEKNRCKELFLGRRVGEKETSRNKSLGLLTEQRKHISTCSLS